MKVSCPACRYPGPLSRALRSRWWLQPLGLEENLTEGPVSVCLELLALESIGFPEFKLRTNSK